jgi:hypothetical protein
MDISQKLPPKLQKLYDDGQALSEEGGERRATVIRHQQRLEDYIYEGRVPTLDGDSLTQFI